MQGRLSTLGAVLVALSQAFQAPAREPAMQKTTIDGMTIELTAPDDVLAATIRPDSPAFDGAATAVTVTFRNDTKRPLPAPLDEISNGLVLIYAVDGRDPIVDNATPPPPHDGSVITLPPGASHIVRLDFRCPESLLPAPLGQPAAVSFCVRWREEWLRVKNYRPGVVQWNKSFEVCDVVRIRPDA